MFHRAHKIPKCECANPQLPESEFPFHLQRREKVAGIFFFCVFLFIFAELEKIIILECTAPTIRSWDICTRRKNSFSRSRCQFWQSVFEHSILPLISHASKMRENNRNGFLYCSPNDDDDDVNDNEDDDDMIKFKFFFAISWNMWNYKQTMHTMGKVKWTSFELSTFAWKLRTFHFHVKRCVACWYFLFVHLLWSSASSWHLSRIHTHTPSHTQFYASVSVSVRAFLLYCVCAGERVVDKNAREECFMPLHIEVLLGRRAHNTYTHITHHAPHPISLDEETMATAASVRQQYINDLCSLNQNNKYTSLPIRPRVRMHKDHNTTHSLSVCIRLSSSEQLFIWSWCTVQNDQN